MREEGDADRKETNQETARQTSNISLGKRQTNWREVTEHKTTVRET